MSSILNQKILNVRLMTKNELKREGWDEDSECPVIVLSNDSHIFPSRDEEGNGPGALFLKNEKGVKPLYRETYNQMTAQTITGVIHNGTVLRLSNGTNLLALSDEEGNRVGVFFGYDTKIDKGLYVMDSVPPKTKKPAMKR